MKHTKKKRKGPFTDEHSNDEKKKEFTYQGPFRCPVCGSSLFKVYVNPYCFGTDNVEIVCANCGVGIFTFFKNEWWIPVFTKKLLKKLSEAKYDKRE